jgi:hypothetical protein
MNKKDCGPEGCAAALSHEETDSRTFVGALGGDVRDEVVYRVGMP